MSINSVLNNDKAAVLDLITVKPKTDVASDVPRAEASDGESGRGFDDALRDASPAERRPGPSGDRGAEASEDRTLRGAEDADKPRGEKPGATEDKPEAKAPEDNAGGGDPGESSGAEDAAEQATADGAQEGQEEGAAGQAGTPHASDRASEAQIALAQIANAAGVAKQAQTAQDQGATQTAQQQAQAAVAKAGLEAAAQNKAQNTAAQNQGVLASTAQAVLQQGASSQTGGEDDAGQAQSGAQAKASAAATTAQASNATAAFTLADPSAGDARLPVSPTAGLQQADAARQAQAAGQAQLAQGDSDAVNTARITRGLANAVQQNGGAVTLRLTPPEMGTVRIQMQITGASVSASFHAESASAQTLLTQQLAQLRTSLESQGMNVDRLSVQPLASTASSQNTQQGGNDGQPGQDQAQQQSANDGRSRGQYRGDGGNGEPSEQGDSPGNAQANARRGFFDRLNDAAQQAA